MSTKSATRPATGPKTEAAPVADSAEQHHPRPAPDEHLCTCGRLRADCVRDTVRGLWSEPAGG
jgi:hypothetical protein